MYIALLKNLQKLSIKCYDVNKGFNAVNLTWLQLKLLSTTTQFFTMSAFNIKTDSFNGVTVLSDEEPRDFKELLERSLKQWQDENKRGIWFKVDLKQADWIPVLANNGFKFHHAKNDYVMMYKWLPRDEECNIPPYAHTMIGVGAVVINDKEEVLVVTEKNIHRPHWKLPGGYVEPGENLVDAAIREVYEETNIHTQFVNILSLRHGHGGQFGCSDLYTVVGLKPLSTDIKKCDREIAASQWMPISEYLKHPHIHELNRFFVKKYIDNKKENITIKCTHGIHQVLKKPYTVYHACNGISGNKST